MFGSEMFGVLIRKVTKEKANNGLNGGGMRRDVYFSYEKGGR
jgi:hypothetical protein